MSDCNLYILVAIQHNKISIKHKQIKVKKQKTNLFTTAKNYSPYVVLLIRSTEVCAQDPLPWGTKHCRSRWRQNDTHQTHEAAQREKAVQVIYPAESKQKQQQQTNKKLHLSKHHNPETQHKLFNETIKLLRCRGKTLLHELFVFNTHWIGMTHSRNTWTQSVTANHMSHNKQKL